MLQIQLTYTHLPLQKLLVFRTKCPYEIPTVVYGVHVYGHMNLKLC